MFNAFFGEETGHAVPEQDTEAEASTSTGDSDATAAANPLINLWSVATAVTSTVKARADELVKSVVDTDWRSELSTFSREVGEESKTLKEKTAELVEHLPDQVVHLPEKAEEALHHLPAQVALPKDVGQTLGGVGVAFAALGKTLLQGTKELIDELKEGVETEIAAATKEGKRAARGKSSAASAAKLSAVQAKYSRYEAEVAAMQRDSSTYCDEPEDAEDYARWKADFSLTGVQADIARITAENAFMAELQSRLVPIIVEHEDFWSRYFYRLQKLQQKEEQRQQLAQQLAQRAKSLHEDDVPLGWGDDDEAAPAAASSSAEGAGKEPSSPATTPSPLPVESTVAADAERPSTPQGSSPAVPTAPAAAEPVAPAEPLSQPSPSASQEPGTSMAKELPSSKSSSAVGALGSADAAGILPALATASTSMGATGGASPAPSGQQQPESPVAKEDARGAQSTGGASVTSSNVEHVDTESGPHDSEPHAETASDSSAREWCVVTSDGKASPGASAAAASEPAASPRLPASSSAGAAEVASPSAPSAAKHGAEAAPTAPSPVLKPEAAAGDKTVAQQSSAGASAVPRAAKTADEEEVDEDWGNWD
ncbi:hypothetical protein GPECTOR_82g254 [Gonium pectorale]|uniref:BSD domain-containing protein n=1 Tax=Gonium pectorale TaxID=33097 RepID=A0A150G328_GONPE|nr:hypothetical protein GPECTOR_82g254 [Gonium pectorale]|eukprot:KXZ43720.1 hypothetical protein GPECTOR_82g254 [Gonium pectorale]